jgi:hypothetical protein
VLLPPGLRAAFIALLAFASGFLTAPASAWTPATQVAIANEASRLTPPDLARQIERRQRLFREGVLAPFEEPDPSRHFKHADGQGTLDRTVSDEVAAAIHAIETHQLFDEVIMRLGRVAHFVADTNNPLAAGNDVDSSRYYADYLRYAESAMPRFPLIFYGLQPQIDQATSVAPLVASALARGRDLAPLIGDAYRENGFASGIGTFDDRSTAFGAASVSFSHAVTDVAQALRYIWLQAGGNDERTGLPAAGSKLLLLPRAVPSH